MTSCSGSVSFVASGSANSVLSDGGRGKLNLHVFLFTRCRARMPLEFCDKVLTLSFETGIAAKIYSSTNSQIFLG